MAISTDSNSKAYIQKTSGGDLKLTLAGFNDVPTTGFDSSKSFVQWSTSLTYPAGEDEKCIDDIEAYVSWSNVTVANNGDIEVLIKTSQWGSLDYDDGNVDNSIGDDDFQIYATGNDPNPTESQWQASRYKDWQNAVQAAQGRFGPISGEENGGFRILLRNSSWGVVDSWDNWDNGLTLEITNGPDGSAIRSGTNFAYSGLSTAGGSGGAGGDPHVITFDGNRYTL